MIVKIFACFLIIIFSISIIDSAEGLVEIKKYKVINSPKVCGDKLCSDMDEEIAKRGESSHNIKICGDMLCSDFSKDPKLFNKSSPLGQMRSGVPLDLIQCKEGNDLVIKTTNFLPACIKTQNIEKLRDQGWAISKIEQHELFEEFSKTRKISSSEKENHLYAKMTITTEDVNNKRYLMFVGRGWHQSHNVEITISGGLFSESIRSKTNNRGELNMPWPIPDLVGGQTYNIFATDGIHIFDIDIPIAPKDSGITLTEGRDRCSRITFPINWAGCDLYGKIMSNLDLRMANLQGSNLFGVTLTGQDLTGADFSGASLKEGNLDGAILIGANLSHANLVDTEIRQADLSYAKLKFAKLYRTDFTNSNLTNANFQDATLAYSVLASTDLRGANLDGAGTWAANLNGCVNHPICN